MLQNCLGLIRSLWRVGKWRVQKVIQLLNLMLSQSGFIEMLKDVIYSENNATVLSNALASLFEISKATSKQILTVDARLAQRLTEMLTECTE